MNTAVLFSSKKDDWETPPELFAQLHAEFCFTLDVAANVDNKKCPIYFGPDHGWDGYRDGLAADWWIGQSDEVAWCNPPYARGLQAKFIAKAAEEARKGANGLLTVVMLLPARTDTKAFHAHIWDGRQHRPRPWVKEVRFLPGRLKFVGATDAAPFPSMIVIFKL
jgi:phage N-6-adenine-methyltransferase